MDPLLRLSVFLTRLVRNPPSRQRAMMMLAALLICLALLLVERFIGWPDWATLERSPRMIRP
ncbi:hypothetical protein [Pseudoroseomonas cervicalis]|uniref:hypothetical protein n=1 Tax=Teichococcus cervicalis TaxID=204525 RepID=UPI0022F1995A|nr:hypothetical protein [Pseudoroseomonas cervicalis]WBV44511.1 hypothetical protein PFY06_08125 [Pseudoroseomonas cervicalis]